MGFQQGFRINTNTSSLDTYRNYSASQAGMERNIERLSSGLRINKAADDSAGLSISNRMNNQVRGLQQANRNVQQGNNLLQTAEGAMNEIGNILGRMRELAVQGASDGVNSDDRASIKLEMDQLSSEITRIADSTEYNDTKVINGNLGNQMSSGTVSATTNASVSTNVGKNTAAETYTISIDKTLGASNSVIDADDEVTLTDGAGNTYSYTLKAGDVSATGEDLASGKTMTFGNSGISITASGGAIDLNTTGASKLEGKTIVVTAGNGAILQVGADNNTNNQISFALDGASSSHLSVDTSNLDGTGGTYQTMIGTLDTAINQINDDRSNIGALQNRLEYTSSNLMNSVQNNAASMSTIRDADFAAEAADLAKNQILVQSGTAMLAQANGLSQNVLALIR